MESRHGLSESSQVTGGFPRKGAPLACHGIIPLPYPASLNEQMEQEPTNPILK